MRRRRRLFWAASIVVGLLLVIAITVTSVLQSRWFYEKVRQRIITEVETATGGRAEIGSFTFDWKRLRAEVKQFVLHGTEPADKPPLFRVSSAAVGLKIISIFKRDIDIQYLDVQTPQVYLIIYPDGRTNVPEPKLKKSDKNAVETILDLAIGRFNIQDGTFEVESRTKTPFSGRGEQLAAHFDYDRAGPRYRGQIAVQPLDIRWPGLGPAPLGVNLAVVVERNRIEVSTGKLTTGKTQVSFSGVLEDLDKPHATVRYDANVAVVDAARVLKLLELRGGTAHATGEARWPSGKDFTADGRFRVEHGEFRDSSTQLRDLRAEGSLHFSPQGLDLSGMRFGGAYVSGATRVPAEGQIARAEIRSAEIVARGIAMSILGGDFRGEGRLRNLERYAVTGNLSNFRARRTVALYSHAPLPWDAGGEGTLSLEGSLRRKTELRASAAITVMPVEGSAPVLGRVNATYDASTEIIEFGNSYLTLPHTFVQFSGAFGQHLLVHFQTTDLQDVLPALGDDAAALPLKLENGRVLFDGTVDGKLDRPGIAGTLNATNASYSGNSVDSLQAHVIASPDNVRLDNASVTRGTLRAQFQFAIGLDDWKTSDASPIFGEASMRNAAVAEVVAQGGEKDLDVTGTVSTTAKFSGTLGNPLLDADVDLNRGAYRGEPFDRLSLHVNSSGETVQVSKGQLDAGAKQATFSATYQHPHGRLDIGRLKAQIASNAFPLDQIETLKATRPGLKGTAQINASGELDLTRSADGKKEEVRPIALQADVTAQGLQLTGQRIGNAHLTAQSQGTVLNARLDSAFAGSTIRGEGRVRLEGDYPSEATVAFSKVDFAELRNWVSTSSPSTGGVPALTGSAEGELHISGPALKPEALQAELRIAKFELGPAPGVSVPGDLTVHNQDPIAMRMANSVVTIESARFVARDTDISITGKANLREKSPLDLRANGRIGLGILADFDADIQAQGVVAMDATIRGDLSAPQVNGRLQLSGASFNLADLPNGISKASGVILFNGDRATIQNLTGETGGGTINLSGFFAYGAGTQAIRVNGAIKQVRVRYPEGVSTLADAEVTLAGTLARSTLSGTVTVLRTGFNPQSDFSSVLASGATPLETPSVTSGFLNGMKLDVAIQTDPQIQFQSSLTQDLQVDANLRLRGTAANPALSGRINITQGQLVFYGTKFTINQGSVSFYNPSKIEPIFDIDLETKSQGVDVTLTVSGPLNKLRLTPRSDPPMQFSEIVQLLATGSAPSTDPVILAQQTTRSQSLGQLGASTLLGQAISQPVGRLQRLFGVSKLRIDPTIGGLDSTAQARVTVEQQITPNLTFTYITNVTTSNPQVVRVEWSFSKQWSAVALREENGVTGMDFFFKKRF